MSSKIILKNTLLKKSFKVRLNVHQNKLNTNEVHKIYEYYFDDKL